MDILTDKTIKTSDFYSRYNGFAYYYNKLDNKYQMSTSAWLKDSVEYVYYKEKKGDTYDSISLEHYNNPTYYWIICDFNKIINPFKNPEPGDILYIPIRGKNLEFTHYWYDYFIY